MTTKSPIETKNENTGYNVSTSDVEIKSLQIHVLEHELKRTKSFIEYQKDVIKDHEKTISDYEDNLLALEEMVFALRLLLAQNGVDTSCIDDD